VVATWNTDRPTVALKATLAAPRWYVTGREACLCRMSSSQAAPCWSRSAITLSPRLQKGVSLFEEVAESVLEGKKSVPISRLTEAISRATEHLEEQAVKEAAPRQNELRGAAKKLQKLLARLDHAGFLTRMQRWTGGHTAEGMKYEVREDGKHVYRCEKEGQALADEAVQNQPLMTDAVWTWLSSKEAQRRHVFGFSLGKCDSARSFLPIVENLGRNAEAMSLFSSYMAGLAQSDRSFVSSRLDYLADEGHVTGEAIVNATQSLGGDSAGIDRIEKLISRGKVNPDYAAQVLDCGGWLDTLTQDECLRLLKAIASSDLAHANATVGFLGMWIHSGKPITGDLAAFAWRCLEAAPVSSTNLDDYHCDELAAFLGAQDPNRAFQLFELLLGQPYEHGTWFPLQRYGQSKFWQALLAADRARAFRTVFEEAARGALQEVQVTWALHEVLDQEKDADILLHLAAENENMARIICKSLAFSRPGFWPVALSVISQYPENVKIQSALAGAVEGMGEVICGSMAEFLEERLKAVTGILDAIATPAGAHPWLTELAEYLKKRAHSERISEADEEVNL